ncbi:MAG: hypothetical protein KF718_31790 [Polyangiaceae bacterium]|nr:hypothetical protein [Polyangiaceae bacterium]
MSQHCTRCSAYRSSGLYRSETFALCERCAQEYRRALALYDQTVRQFTEDQLLTPAEDEELTSYRRYLGLSDSDVDHLDPVIWRARWMYRISTGSLPVVESPVLLGRNEHCHFATGANIMTEIRGRIYVSGSRGASFRIMRGVTLRTGGSRGYSAPVSELQFVGEGHFLITTKRTLFVGTQQLDVPHRKLLSVTPYTDGLELHYTGQRRRILFQLHDSDFAFAMLWVSAQREL